VAIDLCDIHDQPALPLDTLDENIVCKDALFTEWVKADAIIGNPPFLGGKQMRLNFGDDYIKRVFARFPDVKDSVDFCAYWFRLAHDHISENGRVGLVATNSISQGKSRTAALDYVSQNNGYIYDAISTQVWSGEAKVHVSIVNWSREEPKISLLDGVEVAHINSSLKATIDVSQANRLQANLNHCFAGITPVGMGFIIPSEQAKIWGKAEPKNLEVMSPFLEGNDLVANPYTDLKNWIIDFNDMSIEEASDYIQPFQWVQERVKPERILNRRQVYQTYWWKFGERRPAMREALKSVSQYFAVPQTSKWAIFLPCPLHWLPNARTRVVTCDDFYILGILTSNIHRTWVDAQSSTLKGDTSYTHNTCFETFPFPQTPAPKLITTIRAIAQELHD